MRLSSWLSLVLLCGATAVAHEEPFRAAWVQPLAPLVARSLIVPVGVTQGLVPGVDLIMEITPYAIRPAGIGVPEAGDGICLSSACNLGVHGLIATIGVSFEHTFFSATDWDTGVFLAPKLVAAVATEPGDPTPITGTSYEAGVGADLGIEIHARGSGLYVALLLGVQTTAAFGTGDFVIRATWPVALASGSGLGQGGLMTTPNANLFRIGWVF